MKLHNDSEITPEEIRRRADEIQRNWTQQDALQRIADDVTRRILSERWTVPVCSILRDS